MLGNLFNRIENLYIKFTFINKVKILKSILSFNSLFFVLILAALPVTIFLSQNQQDIRQRASEGPPPIGNIDAASCSSFTGWTCDPSDYNQTVDVHFYVDGLAGSGRLIGATNANIARSDLGGPCGGTTNHGFIYTPEIPDDMRDGNPHTVYAYGIDHPGRSNNPLLGGSPKTFTCAQVEYFVTGHVFIDNNSNGQKDPDEQGLEGATIKLRLANEEIRNRDGPYDITIGNNGNFRHRVNLRRTYEAVLLEIPPSYNYPLPGAEENRKATFVIDGSGSGGVYTANIALAPRRALDPLPKGNLDGASCQQFSGWACDGSDWNRSVAVHFYKDALADAGGTYIGNTTANIAREAGVAAECGGNNAHGYVFSTPVSVKDGASHRIFAYAVNSDNPIHANNTLLGGSPKALTCETGGGAPPPSSTPAPPFSPNILSGTVSFAGGTVPQNAKIKITQTGGEGNETHTVNISNSGNYSQAITSRRNFKVEVIGLPPAYVTPVPREPVVMSESRRDINFAVARRDPLPIGHLDGASCQQFSGWTCDGSDWNRSLAVHFYKDGKAGEGGVKIGQTTANTLREAGVATQCGGKNAHGYTFSTPNSLIDGTNHRIFAYAINSDNPIHANNTLLTGSPKPLSCSQPKYSISGKVFKDVNNKRVIDERSDKATAGVSVKLYQGSNQTPIRTVSTDQNGAYTFDNLVKGGDFKISISGIDRGIAIATIKEVVFRNLQRNETGANLLFDPTPGDVNADRTISIEDYNIVLGNMTTWDRTRYMSADVDGNERVNALDWNYVKNPATFGRSL